MKLTELANRCREALRGYISKIVERVSRKDFLVSDNAKDLDETYYVRLGKTIIILGFGGFIAWACFAPLDKGVVAEGFMITSGNRKTVQYQTGGTVDDILVKEGDLVQEKQELLKMNPVQANAMVMSTRQTINGFNEQIIGLQRGIVNQKRQLSLLSEQINNTQDLVKDGYFAKNRLIELQRTEAQLQSVLENDTGNLEHLQYQVREQQEKLKAYLYDLNNTIIRAPVTGHVVGLTVFTRGAVLSPGAKIMDIVPVNEVLLAEAQVPLNLIDKVHVGQTVDLNFVAFNQRSTPKIPAKLITVSADKIVDEKTGNPYFKVQAEVTPKGLKLLSSNEVRPGMPVQAFIVTGERSLMSYLFKPIFDRSSVALTEE